MLAVYLSPLYILWNGIQLWWIVKWMQSCSRIFHTVWAKSLVILLYFFFASSLLLAFFLPASQLQRTMKLISNYWLGVLLYMTMTIGLGLIIRLITKILHLSQNGWMFTERGFVVIGGICVVVTLGMSIWGMVNARIIRTTDYEVTIHKECEGIEELNVVLIADLHMGYNIGTGFIRNMVEKVNEQNADLVVIAGDIFDNQYEALDDPEALSQALSEIKSRYGVYACYGNHDIQEQILAGFTFSSKEKKQSDIRMDQLLENANIHLLRDEGVLVEDAFYLYGRPDYERPGRGITERKSPMELTENMDKTKPILVIDHEPRELQELADAGVDMDLCGHTHDGQMFPGNLTVKLMWENSYGYLKKDQMHNIVTSGVGIFGPFMRVGTKAEICNIKVNFS